MVKTHIAKVRQQNAEVKMQVQNLIGWDDARYADFQHEQGKAYFLHFYGSPEIAEQVFQAKEYWSWWRLHWLRRDREFLSMSILLFPREYEEYYMTLHDFESVEFRPHARIMESNYSKMMHKIIKS